jgi:hypothetical protein
MLSGARRKSNKRTGVLKIMMDDPVFEHLVNEGINQSLTSWDFSWLNTRTEEEPLPWDYRQQVLSHLPGVQSLLDVGTGFSVDACRDNLYTLHQQIQTKGGFTVREHRFLVEAVKA